MRTKRRDLYPTTCLSFLCEGLTQQCCHCCTSLGVRTKQLHGQSLPLVGLHQGGEAPDSGCWGVKVPRTSAQHRASRGGPLGGWKGLGPPGGASTGPEV